MVNFQDSRSTQGILARGANVYNATSASAHSGGGQQYGAPKKTFAPYERMKKQSLDAYNRTGNPSILPYADDPKKAAASGVKQNFPDTPTGASQESKDKFAMSFNPYYAAALRRLEAARATLRSDHELGVRRLNESYDTSFGNIGRQLEDALKANTVDMADRGLLRSGINVAQQGDLVAEYQRIIGELNTSRAQALEDLERALAQGESGLQEQRELLELDRARAEAEERLKEQLEKSIKEANEKALAAMQPKPNAAGKITPANAFTSGNYKVVEDNLGKKFLIDLNTNTRYPITGEGQLKGATTLFGPLEQGWKLTGWNEGPSVVDLYNKHTKGTHGIEKVIAGGSTDPLTNAIFRRLGNP